MSQQENAATAAAAAHGNPAAGNPQAFFNPGLNPMMNPMFYPQMAAFAAAQEATAMIATAKLGNSKSNAQTNSTLVVRSSARRFNVNASIFSVAQWCRKTVEENLEWLVKLVKRNLPNEKAVMLAYGDGCETLVLLDGSANTMPDAINKVPRIPIGASVAKQSDKTDEKQLATRGVLSPGDSIWEHLSYESMNNNSAKNKDANKVENIVFIHSAVTVWGDSLEGRRRVLQVKTGPPGKPFEALSFLPNPIFEELVLTQWKQETVVAVDQDDEPVQWITFNPKELILLEKAFDNRLNARDMKAKVDKPNEDDKKNCQSVIARANNEFTYFGQPVKRRKKNPAAKDGAKAATTSKNETSKVKSPAKSKKTAAKNPTKEADSDDDDDDKPISKMTAEKKSKSKATRKASPVKADKKSNEPGSSKKKSKSKAKK